ncbi:LysR family transcriptional regulator [Melittangium boletus]|uniref:LysR family transcriptional regulator n=1 Tax=Melittangium boletus TaxID=83453 RepID=UPI003DA2943E
MRGSEFADLKAFATIARHGHFARAAAELGVTPSALSQTLRHLEARLGVRLLHRTTRSVAPTEAGARLLARLGAVFAELDLALEEVNAFRDHPTGTLRLIAPRSATEHFLRPVLARYHAACPDVVVDLTVDDAVVDIVAGGWDAGIRLGERLEQDMVAVRLGGPLRQLAVASPAYLARHGTPRTPQDLLQHACINWRQSGTPAPYAWEFAHEGRWFEVAVTGPLVLNDRRLAVDAALAGIGITLWSDRFLQPFLDAGVLVPLLEDYSPPFPGFHLHYPAGRHPPAALRALIDVLREAFPPEPG